MIFKVITDTAAYQAAYKTGQVDMIFLQGAQPEAADLKNLPDSTFDATLGLSYEAVSFNVTKPPLDSRAVRQSVAYASDRDAIVTQLSGPFLPGVKPAQTFRSPVNKKWYSEPFARYRRDLGKVNELMTATQPGQGGRTGATRSWRYLLQAQRVALQGKQLPAVARTLPTA